MALEVIWLYHKDITFSDFGCAHFSYDVVRKVCNSYRKKESKSGVHGGVCIFWSNTAEEKVYPDEIRLIV